MPVSSDLTPDLQHERGYPFAEIQSGVVLSRKSRLTLPGLYRYLDSCRSALDEIEQDLCLKGKSECSADLGRASERLGRFCVEADSWAFNALYEIAFGLQRLLLSSDGHIQGRDFWEALQRGLAVLVALLDQCERDFLWRLAIADTLDHLNQAAQN